jgi:hypothetical protein
MDLDALNLPPTAVIAVPATGNLILLVSEHSL